MTETERVARLMNVGLIAVAIDSGLVVVGTAVGGDPVRADVDGRGTHYARAAEVVGLERRHGAAVVISNIRRTRSLNEVEIGDFMPSFQRGLRKSYFRGRQSIDVVGDGGDGPMMANLTCVLPKSVQQVVGELRSSAHRLCGIRSQ